MGQYSLIRSSGGKGQLNIEEWSTEVDTAPQRPAMALARAGHQLKNRLLATLQYKLQAVDGCECSEMDNRV
jgi:hypothetical protein